MPELNKLEIIGRLKRLDEEKETILSGIKRARGISDKERLNQQTEVRLDQAALRRCVLILEATMAPVVESLPCSDLCTKDKHLEALRNDEHDQAEERSK